VSCFGSFQATVHIRIRLAGTRLSATENGRRKKCTELRSGSDRCTVIAPLPNFGRLVVGSACRNGRSSFPAFVATAPLCCLRRHALPWNSNSARSKRCEPSANRNRRKRRRDSRLPYWFRGVPKLNVRFLHAVVNMCKNAPRFQGRLQQGKPASRLSNDLQLGGLLSSGAHFNLIQRGVQLLDGGSGCVFLRTPSKARY
jgi:hypothetical protein